MNEYSKIYYVGYDFFVTLINLQSSLYFILNAALENKIVTFLQSSNLISKSTLKFITKFIIKFIKKHNN